MLLAGMRGTRTEGIVEAPAGRSQHDAEAVFRDSGPGDLGANPAQILTRWASRQHRLPVAVRQADAVHRSVSAFGCDWTSTDLPITAFALGYSVLWRRNMPALRRARPNAALMYHRNVRVAVYVSPRGAGGDQATILASWSYPVSCVFLDLMKPPRDSLLVVAGWLMTGSGGGALAIIPDGRVVGTREIVESSGTRGLSAISLSLAPT